MTLPELSLQFMYSRLAWGLVAASVTVALWPSTRRLPRRLLATIVGAALLVMALPGSASPAWSLALAFQHPSGLLVGLCLVKLHARWARGNAALPGAPAAPVLPLPAAAALALAGLLVYLDAFGLLSQGYYYAGFGAGAALAAVLLAGACVAAVLRHRGRAQACALLGAVALFSLARLPTGNLWDALLDPLLWGWAVVTVAVAAVRALLRLPKSARPAAPVAGVAP